MQNDYLKLTWRYTRLIVAVIVYLAWTNTALNPLRVTIDPEEAKRFI